MDRLVSSWQKIGESVNSYTYYGYDDMGRAYKSDFCLMGTASGTLTQTYEYSEIAVRRLIECIRVMPNKKILIVLKGGATIEEQVE